MYTTEEARELLTKAGVFFGCDDPDDDPKYAQTINLNDAMYWACSDAEYVEDSELPRVAQLFYLYGWNGIIYWVAVEKRGRDVPEFLDVRRAIEFVTHEEMLRSLVKSSSQKAYVKLEYSIGGDNVPTVIDVINTVKSAFEPKTAKSDEKRDVTVGDLKRLLASIPDDMPVFRVSEEYGAEPLRQSCLPSVTQIEELEFSFGRMFHHGPKKNLNEHLAIRQFNVLAFEG